MARSVTRYVRVDDLFPADDPFAVLVVRFLIRIDELVLISSRIHEVHLKSERISEHLFLIRSASISVADIADTCKSLKSYAPFLDGLDRSSGRDSYCRLLDQLSQLLLRIDHTRSKASAHLNPTTIKNALHSCADSMDRWTVGTTLGSLDLRLVHIVASVAMTSPKRMHGGVDQEEIITHFSAITEALNICSQMTGPLLASYNASTGRLRARSS